MRATVCELPYQPALLEPAWKSLAAHVRSERSELVLLPEFAFAEPVWESTPFDPTRWAAAVALSDAWTARLHELGATWVVGARPVTVDGRHYNEGFAWSAQGGIAGVGVQRPEFGADTQAERQGAGGEARKLGIAALEPGGLPAPGLIGQVELAPQWLVAALG